MSGPRPLKLIARAQDYAEKMLLFEDGSCEYNLPYPCGRRAFELTYDGLSTAEAQLLDDHFEEAEGKTKTFLFYDHIAGRLYSDCRYESYKVSQHKRFWSQGRQISIVRDPG